MKQTWALLLAGALTGAGCFSADKTPDAKGPGAEEAEAIAKVARPLNARPVTRDQVTPTNARDMASALTAELDREAPKALER